MELMGSIVSALRAEMYTCAVEHQKSLEWHSLLFIHKYIKESNNRIDKDCNDCDNVAKSVATIYVTVLDEQRNKNVIFIAPSLSLSLSVCIDFPYGSFEVGILIVGSFQHLLCQGTFCFLLLRFFFYVMIVDNSYVFPFRIYIWIHNTFIIKYNSSVTVNFSSRNQIKSSSLGCLCASAGVFICVRAYKSVRAHAPFPHFSVTRLEMLAKKKKKKKLTSCFVLFVPYLIVVSVCMFAIDFWI